MDSLISTFHIDWHIIVAQAINFLVVLLVLYFFALKPLKKLMDERGKTIEGGLENAKLQEELLAKQKSHYDEIIAKANTEAADRMKEVKKEISALRESEKEKIQEELRALSDTNKKQMEAEKIKIMEEVRREAVGLVVSATEKILGDIAVGKIESKIVEESIKGMQ